LQMATTIVRPEQVRVDEYEFIDVRTAAEFRKIHAVGARNVPLDSLSDSVVAGIAASKRNVLLICKSGARARKAAERMASLGVAQPAVVEGGTDGWRAAGLPVEETSGGVISIDRQTRIFAGSMVLVGVVLGLTVHPAFFGVSGFIGAGLAFSGVTDTCGMARMLAVFPWNR